MSNGINKVILIGNLGKDPKVRYMPSGGAVANLSIATSESWKDKQTGEKKEKTEWHQVVFFNRLGEIAGEYLNKGSKIYIEGKLQTRKWQDDTGNDRYTTEIIGGVLQMLSSNSANQDRPQEQQSAPAPSNTNTSPNSTNTNDPNGFDDFDDDIPF